MLVSVTKKLLIGLIRAIIIKYIIPTHLSTLILPIALMIEEINPPSENKPEKPYSTGTTPEPRTPEPTTTTVIDPKGKGAITKTYGREILERRPNDSKNYRVKKKVFTFGRDITTEESSDLVQSIKFIDVESDSRLTRTRTSPPSLPDRRAIPLREISRGRLSGAEAREERLPREEIAPNIEVDKFRAPPVVSLDSDHHRLNDPDLNEMVIEAEIAAASGANKPPAIRQPKYPYP